MFQKGPQPGYSAKEEVLKRYPNAYCRRIYGNLRGYGVFLSDIKKPFRTAASAREAWEKTLRSLEKQAS